MHWLLEQARMSAKYQFTKFGRLTGRDFNDGAKIILRLLFLTRRSILERKGQRGLSNREKLCECLLFDSGCTGWQSTPLVNINLPNWRKKGKMSYIWFWVHWLPEHVPISARYQFTEYGVPTARDPSERAKIILKLPFLTRRRVSIKIQRALHHKKNWWKWLMFEFGCTGWQSTAQNLVILDLPNLFDWL